MLSGRKKNNPEDHVYPVNKIINRQNIEMKKSKLPIGKSTVRDIRNPAENYAYVDKTMMAYQMIDSASYYFLSRPRRFGKSLFLDTLSEIFKGSKHLFEGLYIFDKWDWNDVYPVIKISFGSGDFSCKERFEERVCDLIVANRRELQIPVEIDFTRSVGSLFSDLIYDAYKKYNKQVVILVDEYDKPILDNIHKADKSIALAAREMLKNFYGSIKDNDQYLKFVFITGVSKFSKLNLFSGLNNIEDITIDRRFDTIAGYTDNDLNTVFAEHLKGYDLEKIKNWYNGYNYLGEPLYNPYDILLFFSKGGEFSNYWWETGNPSFLIEKLKAGNYFLPDLENIIVDDSALNCFDVEEINLVALLWQTGYLTFAEQIESFGLPVYKMKVPNREIQISLNCLFNDYLTGIKSERFAKELDMSKALQSLDFDAFEVAFSSLFAAIPYNNYVKNNIARFEGYYASVVYAALSSLGAEVIAEDTTNKGRVDLTLKTDSAIVLFEFKVDMPDESALEQIKKKKYYEKYLSENKDIYLVGIHFDSKQRNIAGFRFERYMA